MQTKTTILKTMTIIILTCIITVLHYRASHGNLGMHILHRELYTIPILLAGLWFGLKAGLLTSGAVSLIYAPHIIMYSDAHSQILTVFSQLFFFNIVALVLGWLTDRQKEQQADLIVSEKLAVLGRAATAVGYEMEDILGELQKAVHRSEGLQATELDQNFQQELNRLERLVKNLSSFVPEDQFQMLSTDLNPIIRERIMHHKQKSKAAGVSFEIDLDESGCPSQVNIEKIGWILDQLIQNALEVSAEGQRIRIKSKRGGDYCRVVVRDQGPGIRPEHLPKMFQPFFTTNNKGTGLSLSCCKKILKDMGGDISLESRWGDGAAFTINVPREEHKESYRNKVVSKISGGGRI